VEVVKWTEATEVTSIATADVGIMPLLDSQWERGKCGYKLIQYMACGLPVVASAVGVNGEIVEQGLNGFLPTTPAQWVDALDELLTHRHVRERMGRAGRRRVEAIYCIQKTGPLVIDLLKKATKGAKPCVD
jgi:glycosyltransferase involved in cell wall biosynthesis